MCISWFNVSCDLDLEVTQGDGSTLGVERA